MKLFYTKRSPYARKVRIIALEKKIAMDLIEEDLTQKTDNLVLDNPIGRIPTLELDDGRVLCDSTLIGEFLDSINDGLKLLPQDSTEQLKVKNIDFVAKGLIDVTVGLFYEKFKHPQNFHQGYVKNQEETIKRTLKYFNDNIVMLKEFNMAAVNVICAVGYIIFRAPHLWVDSEYGNLKQWYDKHQARASVKDTIPQNG